MSALSPRGDKRYRRTKSQIETLRQQMVDVLEADHPQSVRHVYYRMGVPGLAETIDKTDQGYSQTKYHMKHLRRAGRIPYGWVSDATRTGYHVTTYGDAADFLRRTAGLYRADMWRDSGHYVEVWCESRSIAGVIRDDCEELGVSLYPAGGFASISFCYEATQFLNQAAEFGKRPAEIVYIGDYDPAGVLIDKTIEGEIRKHLDPDVALTFHRIAINPEQIAEYDLPTKPRKRNDRRARHVTETVEAEAMPARILRRLLREKIESFLPERALDVAKAAEESERAYLASIAEAMRRRGAGR